MTHQSRREKVGRLIKQDILISPELLEEVDREGYAEVSRSGVVLQKEKNNDQPALRCTPHPRTDKISEKHGNVKVAVSYTEKPKKRGVQDFVSYFNSRYTALESLLQQRREMQNMTSISRIKGTAVDKASIIGMVNGKKITKNGNILLSLEDRTGNIKVVVGKHKTHSFREAADTVCDEVLGVDGAVKGDIMFANKIVNPDIPLNTTLKKSPYEGYAVFLSDIHVGSNNFLSKEFNRFLKWVSGEAGTDKQREISRKVKYVIIAGDIVDGVGIFPNQQDELEIKDIYQQYKECASLLSRIPPHIRIVVCPGNHDASRISEPQPPFSSEFASPIISLPNVIPVSNPSIINIDSSEKFDGFDILLYHGYSFDYYIANVDSIRLHGGYDNPELIMKFLLKRRHLAPTHTSTLYIPDAERDPLFIGKVPDIFATGHLHKTSVSHYKSITLISGSCWQSKTPFQEKLGHKPEPARVPVVNLHTRDVKILRFGD